MVIVVDVVEDAVTAGTATAGNTQVVEVVSAATSPTETTNLSESTINVVSPGGTVANVQWGYDFPPSPTEGQIFLKVTLP